jgi:hypothetical protein
MKSAIDIPFLSLASFVCAVVLFFSSCTANRQERQVTHQIGIQAGQPTELTTTTQTTEESTSGVDVGALVSAAVQASQGKILGALDSLKPQPLPDHGPDWGTIAGGGAAALMALMAAMQAKQASSTKKEKEVIAADRDSAYERLIEANRQLPPKV